MRLKKQACIRALTPFILAAFLIGAAPAVSSGAQEAPEASAATAAAELPAASVRNTYAAYLSGLAQKSRAVSVFEANPQTGFSESAVTPDADGAGTPGVVVADGGAALLRFTVPQSGMYTIQLHYLAREGKGSSLQAEIALDGAQPFFEAGQITLFRTWVDEAPAGSRQDALGNDMIPEQAELPVWQDAYLEDHSGKYTDPYLFYLEAGEHTLSYQSIKEPVVIGGLLFAPEKTLPTYEEALQEYERAGLHEVSDVLIPVRAENPVRKSDSTLYARNDRSSPATDPASASCILLNTIGADSWASSGQWIEWELTVPETGLYRLAFRARQNLLSGASSSRRIYLDGEIPFEEFKALPFQYKSGWQIVTPDYLLALTAGTHTLRMEVTTGALAEAISLVDNAISELNRAYRQIIMITGVSPDVYRDYRLDEQIPHVFEVFAQQAQALRRCDESLLAISGRRGSVNGTLQSVIRQMERFVKKPEQVQKQLSNFKSNIGALSSWLITVRHQSLELDTIYLCGAGAKLPKAEAGFGAKLWYEARLFISSFIVDYSYIGGQSGLHESIEVWIDSGRDQATILQELSARFVEETGIGADIKLVNGQLLSATMAGSGPDVALNLTQTNPINYAVRGAVVDLTQFRTADVSFDEVKQRFRPSAFVPLELNGAVYALPETQTFPVLYYRSDIFEELNLAPPETWKDVFRVLNVLQKNNMTIGIPAPSSVVGAADAMTSYLILLLQHGGTLYSDDHKSSALDSAEAADAFREWCSLYIDYNLDLKYDAATRFRSGEMPMIVSDFTLYNNLSIAAPEIRGLWKIAPVPGTADENGVVHHDASSVGNSCVMMTDCQNRDAAWRFLEWWTRAETQADFGREMENRLGESARYPSANVEAFATMSWPAADFAMLQSQWQDIHGIPEVPGGYFTSRHLNNAFRRVLYYNEDPYETLIQYTRYINQEIEQKRRELKLD